jgi:hypothetical protein
MWSDRLAIVCINLIDVYVRASIGASRLLRGAPRRDLDRS